MGVVQFFAPLGYRELSREHIPNQKIDLSLFVSAKPIDLLASYINADEESEDLDIEMHEPYTYLNVSI